MVCPVVESAERYLCWARRTTLPSKARSVFIRADAAGAGLHHQLSPSTMGQSGLRYYSRASRAREKAALCSTAAYQHAADDEEEGCARRTSNRASSDEAPFLPNVYRSECLRLHTMRAHVTVRGPSRKYVRVASTRRQRNWSNEGAWAGLCPGRVWLLSGYYL